MYYTACSDPPLSAALALRQQVHTTTSGFRPCWESNPGLPTQAFYQMSYKPSPSLELAWTWLCRLAGLRLKAILLLLPLSAGTPS